MNMTVHNEPVCTFPNIFLSIKCQKDNFNYCVVIYSMLKIKIYFNEISLFIMK